MKFWRYLRLIGSLIVLCIAVLVILVAVLRARQADDDTTPRALPPLQQQSGTHGL